MNYLQLLASEKVPGFVKEDYPIFAQFIDSYYEWLSSDVGNAGLSLKSKLDIDDSLETFITHFQNVYLNNIPKDIAIDKATMVKHAKELYSAKGTEEAVKLLFKILYNDEVTISNPKDKILRSSDGTWGSQDILRISRSTTRYKDLAGTKIVGQTSGAVAHVESVTEFDLKGTFVTQLSITDITGEFQALEFIISTLPDSFIVQEQLLAIVGSVKVTNKGIEYSIGDKVIATGGSGVGFDAEVASISSGSLTSIDVISGGSQYLVNDVVEFSPSGYPTVVWTPGALYLLGNTVRAGIKFYRCIKSGNAGTDSLPIATGKIKDGSVEWVMLDNYNGVGIVTAIGGGGSITSVKLLSTTSSWTKIPYYFISSVNGINATLRPRSLTIGAINSIKMLDFGVNYTTLPSLSVSSTGSGAVLNPIQSADGYSEGKFLTTAGMLSDDQVLQDGNFYQEYSYVIRSSQYVEKYRKLLTDLVHPAGMIVFGDVGIEESPFPPPAAFGGIPNKIDNNSKYGGKQFRDLLVHIKSNVPIASPSVLTDSRTISFEKTLPLITQTQGQVKSRLVSAFDMWYKFRFTSRGVGSIGDELISDWERNVTNNPNIYTKQTYIQPDAEYWLVA